MMRWNSTKTYTEDDILRMQQDAVNRVHEFQTRAQEATSYFDSPTIGEYREPLPVIEAQSRVLPEPAPEPQPFVAASDNAPAHPLASPVATVTDPIKGLLERFDIDSETLLILGLLFVLYNEKADSVLLLGLAYLLL